MCGLYLTNKHYHLSFYYIIKFRLSVSVNVNSQATFAYRCLIYDLTKLVSDCTFIFFCAALDLK
jgi:hypothetical protein